MNMPVGMFPVPVDASSDVACYSWPGEAGKGFSITRVDPSDGKNSLLMFAVFNPVSYIFLVVC